MKYYTDRRRHLVCLPYSIDNLHKMADDLTLGRHWYHGHPYPHYDIPKSRIEDIESKCIIVSAKDVVRICKGEFNEPACTA